MWPCAEQCVSQGAVRRVPVYRTLRAGEITRNLSTLFIVPLVYSVTDSSANAQISRLIGV